MFANLIIAIVTTKTHIAIFIVLLTSQPKINDATRRTPPLILGI